MTRLPAEVRSALRMFAFFVGNGTLDQSVLGGIDYRRDLLEFGSDLEALVAVFANCLDIDKHGHVTNEAAASRRAAQWLRSCCDPEYVVQPPFADWETELA